MYATSEHLCKEERNSPGYNDRYHSEHDPIKTFAVIWSENPAVEEHEAQLDKAQSQDQHQLYCPKYLASVSQRDGAACGFPTWLVTLCWYVPATKAKSVLVAAGFG